MDATGDRASGSFSRPDLLRGLARIGLGLLLCASLTACEWQFSSGHDDDDECDKSKDNCGGVIVTQSATFGGQDLANVFLEAHGVDSVERGWTGGWTPWVGPGLAPLTGHSAAVRVHFDPAATSYETLLGIALAAREHSGCATTWPRGDLQLGTARAEALWRSGGAHGPRLVVRSPAPFHPAAP